MRENTDQNNSKYGHFSRSDSTLRKLHFAELKKANEHYFIEFMELKNPMSKACQN